MSQGGFHRRGPSCEQVLPVILGVYDWCSDTYCIRYKRNSARPGQGRGDGDGGGGGLPHAEFCHDCFGRKIGDTTSVSDERGETARAVGRYNEEIGITAEESVQRRGAERTVDFLGKAS